MKIKKERRSSLNGSKSYALDTSFLVYHYYKGDERTNRFFEEGVTNLVTICETLYTICRKEGLQRALDFVKEVSKRVKIIPSESHTNSRAVQVQVLNFSR
jgi:predicted nucleic acid-binding protein